MMWFHNHLGVYSGFPVWIAHREGVPVISTFHATQIDDPHNWWLRLPVLTKLRKLVRPNKHWLCRQKFRNGYEGSLKACWKTWRRKVGSCVARVKSYTWA